ncbi:hypothetical protein LOZ36_000581 [Ophidiomyces ophidiicola]|nr:hypothetical protein LOZ36_000581 [Ophidiomyces ophidiicola]
MEWSSVSDVVTFFLSGNGIAILVTCLVAFLLPICIHLALYRAASAETHNDFLLLGPSGVGKTALCALLERKPRPGSTASPQTHTSQTSSFISAVLPASIPIGSNAYRSVNDPTLADRKHTLVKYRVRDTPGHGKLRDSEGFALLRSMTDVRAKSGATRGLIFMVDAAAVLDEAELRDTAGYLHDILLFLQKRHMSNRTTVFKKAPNIPVLVAANKQDLFTSLPVTSVKERLESEIEKIRQSKRKGVLHADVQAGDDEQEILGGDEGQEIFTFKMLEEEAGVGVTVIGGSVKCKDAADTKAGISQWEEWVGSCL